MSDTDSSSGERAASKAAKDRGRRARRIILISTAVACAVGAISTSFSPPKTVSAYPPVAGAQPSPTPAPPARDSGAPGPAPKETPAHEDTEGKALRPGAVPVTVPADAAHSDIPALAFEAYQRAADEQAARTPGCHLPWTLLAAIGQVESNHARNGALTSEGFTASPILGPVLNGGPFAALRDSDQGKFDGDTAWDRAVGPMQFIPSTWKRWGTTTRPTLDADPNNIFDATTTAAAYLCADNRDLSDPQQLNRAILSYNPSEVYLRDVLAWNSVYTSGHTVGAMAVPALPALPALPAVDAVDGGGTGPGGRMNGGPAPSVAAGQVVEAALSGRMGQGGGVSRPAGGHTAVTVTAGGVKGVPSTPPRPAAGPGAGTGAARPSSNGHHAPPPQQLPQPESGVHVPEPVRPAAPSAAGSAPDSAPPRAETGSGAPHTSSPARSASPSLLATATNRIGGVLDHLGRRILG
ncbi:hypothetical protein [Streptomyces sp. NPDC001508]|uniref:lytic transglycosylase domain-containing protein n=1 Tax=Streptomyces sp. NPDC001508 TaxID=3154656 RepID=UPI00332E6DFA